MTGPATSWADALVSAAGPKRHEEAVRFAARAPAGYQERVEMDQAVADLDELAALESAGTIPAGGDLDRPTTGFDGPHRLSVSPDPRRPGLLRLHRYGWRSVELSSWIPVFTSFGLAATEVSQVVFGPEGGAPAVHIDDFGLRPESAGGVGVDADRLVAALEAVTGGRTDTDELNRLVVDAGLTWRQTTLLRALRRYRRQAGSASSDAALDAPLLARPAVAAAVVAYFEARFDPDLSGRDEVVATRRAALDVLLDEVSSLDEDRVLRGLVGLVDAVVRTSYFLDATATGDAPLVLKLRSAAVPDLPLPRPAVEAWVHGPAVEGIHLRFGLVARGGLRWSDRPDDFRTEVLDLADAQVKKNAIIVPTGAKGGFVCRWPAPTPETVRSCYRSFVSSLLSVTDNLVAGQVIRPERVVAHDGDDPYLVVAADRGTATFSDLANSLAAERHFWLGDAFASGGSHGYDHKAMGVTAKGAWVAVRRHFRQLGLDADRDPLRAVGVGDMSGDVFGNGMLRSRSLLLVAAFDHRHVFVDPDPDPGVSYDERARLAALPRSSWDDYDRSTLSAGGGVWSREAKSIPIAPALGRALGIADAELSPPELIRAILSAQVDLLWFGGIGTYVRAPGETDADVGDPANDEVRITADQLRVRVVAEGANLGITQRGRIRYSRRGGRINTDFIDNAAGVATSDREVNLKILLGLAVEEGRLDVDERDGLLAEVGDHVEHDVLRQVDHSVDALNRAVPESAGSLDSHEALLEDLEREGRVNREVERLPDAEEWATRRAAGAGLIRPELAVLLAVAKSELAEAIGDDPMAAAPALEDSVVPYFPPVFRDRFADLIPRHRLYRELVATDVAGEIVDRMGIAWAHETGAELGRPLPVVAVAFWTARQVLDAGALWDDIERAGAVDLDADAEAAAHAALRSSVGRLARRYLVATTGDPLARIVSDRAAAAVLEVGDEWAGVHDLAIVDADLASSGVPVALRDQLRRRHRASGVADAVDVAARCGRTPGEVLAAADAVDGAAGLGPLGVALAAVRGRWPSWAARALLDDLTHWRMAVAGTALAGSGSTGDPSAAVRAVLAERRAERARVTELVDSLGAPGVDAVSVGSLVVRSLPSP